MRFWWLFVASFVVNHCTFDQHSSEPAEKGESSGKSALASVQAGDHPLGQDRVGTHQKGDLKSPFKGQWLCASPQPCNGSQDGIFPLALLVRTTEPQDTRVVSEVPQALDVRRASLHQRRGGGLPGQERLGAGRQRGSTPRGRKPSASPRNKKGKGKKGKKEAQTTSFAPLATPWPTTETTMTETSKPVQVPLPPHKEQSSSSIAASAGAELLGAVRKHYPDLADAPPDIKEAVQKAEALNSKQIAAELTKSSKRVGEIAQQLAELKEMQQRHRAAWVKHLKEALQSWESQINAYVTQQKTYHELMTKAQSELEAARVETQRLNYRAGKATKVEESIDLTNVEDVLGKDDEAANLVGQVQDLLDRCAKMTKQEIKDDEKDEEDMISSEGEETMPKKRQRSLEPFGGKPAGGGSSAPATS